MQAQQGEGSLLCRPAQPQAGLAGFGSSSGAGLVRHAVSAAAQPPSPAMISRGETIYG